MLVLGSNYDLLHILPNPFEKRTSESAVFAGVICRDLAKAWERAIIVKDFYPNFPKKEVVANERKLYA
jgi:hypothetical protein